VQRVREFIQGEEVRRRGRSSPSFDTELFVSPMRQNLTFQQFFFPEGVDSPSSHALMMDAACSAIEGRAMAKRVVIFAMYKFQFCGIVSWLTKKFPKFFQGDLL
jgi:hypothetical protein